MSQHDPNAPVAAVPAEAARPDPRVAAQEAGGAAWQIIQELVKDPFAALKNAAAASAQTRLGVGVVFAAVFVVAWTIAAGGLIAAMASSFGAAGGGSGGAMLKAAIVGAAGFAGIVGGLFGARAIFKAKGDPVTDVVAAGIALLPYSAVLLISRIISASQFTLMLLFALIAFAGSFATIMLFDYLSNVAGTQKRQALLGVPLAILGFGVATWIIGKIIS